MKTKFFMMMALVVLLIGGNACTEEDKGLTPGDDTSLGNGGDAVPDPEGTILVSVRNESNGKTIVKLSEVGTFYIDEGDNFVSSSTDIEFCSVGAVNSLGNIRAVPDKGWASRVAVQKGYGYWVRTKTVYDYKYARLYVDDYILSAINTILGVYIKYQSPYTPVNPEDLLEYFPDKAFKDYVLRKFDVDNNKRLTQKEADLVKSIKCVKMGISSLKGIEFFTNLTSLECDSNQLTTLDMSKNVLLTWLGCDANQLTSLDVSSNKALDYLSCMSNQLNSLNLTSNPVLNRLHCDNNYLKSLDVSANKILGILDCNNNRLTSLDVSANTALFSLGCNNNQLNTLNVSSNRMLQSLGCHSNKLRVLDMSKNPNLTYLSCWNNELTELNISANTLLESLYCYDNQLRSLDVSKHTLLHFLNCYDNQISVLDVSRCVNLSILYCNDNQIQALDLSKNTQLTHVWCYRNQLTSLDISENRALESLACTSNPGDGSVFPVTAWFDNSNIPENFSKGSYTYEGKTVSIVYNKKN